MPGVRILDCDLSNCVAMLSSLEIARCKTHAYVHGDVIDFLRKGEDAYEPTRIYWRAHLRDSPFT